MWVACGGYPVFLQWQHQPREHDLQVCTPSCGVLPCVLQGLGSLAWPLKSLRLTFPVCGCQISALLVYMFCGWFTDRFVLVFVTLVLLLAFDFWTVKV